MGSWLGSRFLTSGDGGITLFVSGGMSDSGLTEGKSGSVNFNQEILVVSFS